MVVKSEQYRFHLVQKSIKIAKICNRNLIIWTTKHCVVKEWGIRSVLLMNNRGSFYKDHKV